MKSDESLREKLEKQSLGDHLCCIYRDKEEQLSALSSFMSVGIDRGEKCLYIVDDRTKEEVIDAFVGTGVEIEELIESGQFEFLTKKGAYLKDGYFDPDEMIDLLRKVEEEALDQGYEGLRATGEMTWFFTGLPGTERLMEYETKLNEFLPDQKIIALCQYNEEKFSPETLVDVLHTHPKVLFYNDLHENMLYMPPRVFKAQEEGKVTREHYERMKEKIIERTRLMRKEEKTEEKFRKFFEEIGDAVFVESLEPESFGKILEANPAAEEQTGYSRDELIGMNVIQDFIVSEPLETSQEQINEKLKSGEPVSFTRKHHYKNGEERWVEAVLTPIEYEGEEASISVNRDITERKKMEEELRESRERFERAIEEAPFPAVLHAGDGEVVKVNEVWSDITGYAIEDIPTISDWAQKAYGEEKEEMEEVIDRLHEEEGRFSEGESEIKTKDGEKRIWDFMSTNLGELPDGRSLVLSMAQDITERKRAEEKKDFLNTLLRQDLKSKYQNVQGYLQLIEEENIPPKEREYLRKALKSNAEANEILMQAEELREIENTEWTAENDILKVMEHVIEDVSNLAEKENVQIEEEYPENIGKAKGDYSLNNLFTLILETRIKTYDIDKIKISGKETTNKILLRFEDDGKKLSNDMKELFSGKIYTGETTGARGARHYMIRRIADHNDARIDVYDSELGGARFDVYLEKL